MSVTVPSFLFMLLERLLSVIVIYVYVIIHRLGINLSFGEDIVKMFIELAISILISVAYFKMEKKIRRRSVR